MSLHFWVLVFQRARDALGEIWPYVVAGILIGELLKLTSWTRIIYKGVSRSPFSATLVAVVWGMCSPLCTYGTVPVLLQLFRAGVPLAPLVAFLAASALMNPQLFIMTWGGLGCEMAIVRVITVFVFGLLVGGVLQRIPSRWMANPGALVDGEMQEILLQPPKVFEWRDFVRGFLDSLQFVGFYLVIGLILGAIVEVGVPAQWISHTFRLDRWWSVGLGAIMGVPLYACGGGVIPFVRSMMMQGMSKGAALAFLLVGPATRITPLMALATVLRPRFILVYILSLFLFSVAVGLVYQWICPWTLLG